MSKTKSDAMVLTLKDEGGRPLETFTLRPLGLQTILKCTVGYNAVDEWIKVGL